MGLSAFNDRPLSRVYNEHFLLVLKAKCGINFATRNNFEDPASYHGAKLSADDEMMGDESKRLIDKGQGVPNSVFSKQRWPKLSPEQKQ